MKNLFHVTCSFFLLCTTSQDVLGQYLADQTFNTLIRHYDPQDRWRTYHGEMHLFSLSKDWSTQEDLVLDIGESFFQAVMFAKENTVTRGVARGVPFYNVDNQPDLSEEERRERNLSDEAVRFIRHHHIAHFGLPMYLAELGAPLKKAVVREIFNGKECLVLEFSSLPGTSPHPYFNAPLFLYVNPETGSMEGIRYTETNNPLNGLYAIFNGEISVGGIVVPQVKTYYRTADDSYVFTDAFFPFTKGQYAGMEAEKIAIRQVVDAETIYFYSRDFKKWADCWSHEPYVYFSVSSRNGYNIKKGWDAVSENMRTYMLNNPDPHSPPIERSNFSYHIQGDLAWVYYDNREGDAYGKQQRVLHKENGEWKIVNMTTIDEGSYLELGHFKRMIFLKFKREVPPEKIDSLRRLLTGMPGKINGMLSALWMESPDEHSPYSHSITLEFDSEEALRAYELHEDQLTFDLESRSFFQTYSVEDYRVEN